MKRQSTALIIALITILWASAALAGNCYSDPVVKRWLQEREHAAERTVQLWAQGSSPEEFVSEVAVITSNELYVFSQCREQPDFLKTHVYVITGGNEPKVESVPAIILEHLVDEGMLSPWVQFPSDQRAEVIKK